VVSSTSEVSQGLNPLLNHQVVVRGDFDELATAQLAADKADGRTWNI